ncbi:hypothetical protein Ocin01_13642 [Orchesella cincta]|uniref:Uncharacterized protein n=1 Tax=Orchesella cincta TaxID=48709 RepID=A0A1D2MJ58_ORCCI|nr:hypothetical protein Ocin01_13642 [Orchesella cincta]
MISESESEAERRVFVIVVCSMLYRLIRLYDAIYHSTYAILLLISGCTLIYSAAKIDQLVEDASATEDPADLESRKLLNAEKIVVGVLTFKLAVLYGVTSVTIFHRVKDVMYSNLLL